MAAGGNENQKSTWMRCVEFAQRLFLGPPGETSTHTNVSVTSNHPKVTETSNDLKVSGTSNHPKVSVSSKARENDVQVIQSSKPRCVKPPAPLPPSPRQTKTPSENIQNQPTLPQTDVPEGKGNPEDGQKNKTWVENQDEQPSGTPKLSSLIQDNNVIAAHSTNETASSIKVNQMKVQEQLKEQLRIKIPETPNDNLPNMQKKRASTEKPPTPKRPDRGTERSKKIATITADPNASESQDKVPQKTCLPPSPSNQDNQKLEARQKTESLSKNNPEIQAKTLQQTEDAEPSPFSSNQEDRNLETSQKIEDISWSANQDAKAAHIQQHRYKKNVQTPKSNELHHHEHQDKISSVASITRPEDQFVGQGTMKPSQQERDQGERQNLYKKDVRNVPPGSPKSAHVSEKQNSEVPPQKIPHTSEKSTLGVPPQTIAHSSEKKNSEVPLQEISHVCEEQILELRLQAIHQTPKKQESEVLRNFKITDPTASEEKIPQNVLAAPQKPAKEGPTTEATPITQEKTTSSGEDPILQSIRDQIASVLQEVEAQEKEIEEFVGTSTDDREYTYIDELLMRNLIKLDNIGTANNPAARQERKKAIQFVQTTLKKLDAKLTENQTNSSEDDKEVGITLNVNFKAEIRDSKT